jgi:serine/threonine protein phosphatase PrpC
MEEFKCRSCGTPNRKGAKFCQKCGKPLPTTDRKAAPARPNKGLVGKMASILKQVDDELDVMFSGENAAPDQPSDPNPQGKEAVVATPTGPPPPQPAAQPASSPAPPAVPPPGGIRTIPARSASANVLYQAIPPKVPGERIAGYVIQRVWPLLRSNYYKVCLARCPQGHVNPSTVGDRCNTCQSELQIFLMHETTLTPAFSSDPTRQALIELSRRQFPGILKHSAVLSIQNRQFIVVDYPGEPWLSLAQVNLPIPNPNRVVAWCLNIGQALANLSEHNLVPEAPVPVDYLEPLVLLSNDQPCFADLGIFNPRPPGSPSEPQKSQKKEISFLGQVFYMLVSGSRQPVLQAPGNLTEVPPIYRKVLTRLRQDEFSSLTGFMDAIRQTLATKEFNRSLRQIPSHRTDQGQVRDHNEDFVGKWSLGMQQSPDDPEVGLYLVADGMGGHQAGELASRSVVQVMLDEVQQKAQDLQNVPKLKRSTIKLDQATTPGEVLRQAVLRANEVLYNSRKRLSSDRGTTLTAALVVGDVCAVANVGDSRTYLLHQDRLEQVSIDHSLVASLVSANMLKPEEVRSHPQRNTIFRTLGDKLALEVDIFERSLSSGDRLLLCSDGLWEMVLDHEIESIMTEASNPAAACDRLIEAANQAGGVDNIGVVVIWLE